MNRPQLLRAIRANRAAQAKQKNRLSSLILLSYLLAQLPLTALADPIPTNPDDYDVAKYQRLYETNHGATASEQQKLDSFNLSLKQAIDQLSVRQKMVTDLDAQILATQNNITRLQQENDRLQADVARLNGQLSSQQGQVSNAQAQVSNAEAQVSQIQGQLDAANRVVADRQAAYDAKNREVAPALEALRQAQAALASAQTALNQGNSKVSSDQSQISLAQSQLASLQNQETQINNGVGRAQTDVSSAQQSLAAAQSALSAAQADEAPAQAAVAAAAEKQKEAEARLQDAINTGKPASTIQEFKLLADNARAESQRALAASVDVKKRIMAAQRQVTAANQTITNAQNQVNALNTQLNAVRAQIPTAQSHVSDAQAQLSRDQSAIGSLQSAVSSAQTNVDRESSATAAVQAQLNAVKADLDRARSDASGVQTRLSQAQSSVNSARTNLSNLQSSIQTTQRQITDSQAKVDQNRGLLNQAQAQLPGLTANRATAAANADGVRRQVDQYNAAVADQRNRVAAAQAAEQGSYNRLNQVRANLQRGMQVATDDGNRDGYQAGVRDGNAKGTDSGNRDGANDGVRKGQEDGQAAGAQAARQNGANDGNAKGASDGAAAGASEGASQGASVGSQEGSARGVSDARDQGTAKGTSDGTTAGTAAGHQSGSYDRGLADGTAKGQARGTQEGTDKGTADGIKQADKEALGAKLPNVTIPMASPALASMGTAMKSAFTQSAELNSLTASTLGRYPIPDLDHQYEAAYQASYQQTYDAQYKASAAAAYDRAYRASYQDAYNRAAQGDFTAAYQTAYRDAYNSAESKAHDQSYQSSYQAAYQDAYNREYGKVFSGAYDPAYKSAYDTAYARSRDATSAADLAKGRADGDKKGYASTYQKSYDAAKAASYADRKASYDQNAVLNYQSAVSQDQNQDGVNTPGESILLNLSLKNFGRTAAAAGTATVELSVPSSGLQITQASTSLPELPAASNILIKGLTALRVAPEAPIGSKQSVIVSLVSGGAVLGSSTVELTVGTTMSLATVEVTGKVSANADNTLHIIVKNKSAKAALGEATVEILSTDGLATVANPSISLGVLNGSESKDIKTTFRFVDSPVPDKLSFQVLVRVNGATFDSKALAVKSAERYAYNASSKGLLLANTADNVAAAQAARKAAGLGLDLFDERQEGALTSAIALKYASKVVIVPEANSKIKSDSVKAISAAFAKNVSLVVGMDATTAKTEIGALATSTAKKRVTRDLLGLKLAERNAFTTDLSVLKVITTNPASVIGTDGLANALLISDIALRPTAEKAKGLLASTASGDSREAGFLKAALSSELIQEMKDDVSISGKNFEKNPSKLRLTQVLTILQAASPAEKKVLGSLYSDLEAARAALTGNQSRKDAILKLLEPLKDAADGI